MTEKGRMKARSPKLKRALAKDYMIHHPDAPNYEVAQAIGISERLVSMGRAELRKVGLAKASAWDHTSNRGVTQDPDAEPVENLEVKSTADLMKEIEAHVGDINDATPAEMKRVLSRIIHNPSLPPNIRIQAIAAKQKIDYESADKNELGPGVPLSREAAIMRVVNLIRAIGPEMLQEAISRAFSVGDANGKEKAVDSGDASAPPTQDTEPLAGDTTIGTTEGYDSQSGMGLPGSNM